MKLYIAGPMTGLPDFNTPAFNEAARELEAQGYEVVNPADNSGDTTQPYEYYLKLGLRQLLECEALAVLPGWWDSRGARLEAEVAAACKMRRFYYDGGELLEFTTERGSLSGNSYDPRSRRQA